MQRAGDSRNRYNFRHCAGRRFREFEGKRPATKAQSSKPLDLKSSFQLNLNFCIHGRLSIFHTALSSVPVLKGMSIQKDMELCTIENSRAFLEWDIRTSRLVSSEMTRGYTAVRESEARGKKLPRLANPISDHMAHSKLPLGSALHGRSISGSILLIAIIALPMPLRTTPVLSLS